MKKPPFMPISAMIERHLASTPDAVALDAPDAQLSFSQLHDLVTALALRLRERGIGSESRVAIYAERGSGFVVALLAVLKCGACYVPLDKAHPLRHVARILGEAAPALLLADCALPGELAAAAPCVLPIAGAPATTAVAPDWHAEVLPAAAAYVMYTSGSTGEPLGALITHLSISRYAAALVKALGLGPGARYLHTASFGFSSSVRQLLVPLAAGMRVVLAPAPLVDAGVLAGLAQGPQALVCDMTPSVYAALLATPEGGAAALAGVLPSHILAASEPLSAPALAAMAGFGAGRARIFNMYGQTETCGIVAVFEASSQETGPVLPIGKPIPGARIYLLDRALERAAIGVPGELYIGGAALARGYLDQPGLTAERFLPNPFAEGERLYRTGDTARWRADGNLEFLGRIDHQVKLRGARVELGQVEAALAALPGVAGAAARVHGAGAEAMLVAYAVPEAGVTLAPQALLEALGERLPAYMTPHTVLVLAALPLGVNGKLDRQALAPVPAAGACAGAFVAPAAGLECELARIWAEVLKIERVGAQDSFFELGGHSLLAMTLIARVNRAFGVKLKLISLMNSPTVARMAHQIERAQLASAAPAAVS